MALDIRSLASPQPGFCAFVNLYSPQALLPELAKEFGVGAERDLLADDCRHRAIALTAPFTGALADMVGRKRLITAAMFAVVVPTLIMTMVASVPAFVFLAVCAGDCCCRRSSPSPSPISATNGRRRTSHASPGSTLSGTSIGGFCGRFIPGVLSDLIGWRVAFPLSR